MKQYIIYKITNIINDHIYVGYHSTDNVDDNYMGSGKRLGHAIDKYGIQNFKKEILHIFDNKQDALKMEKEIVNEAFVLREDTYNLKIGGEGGWDHTWEINTRPEIVAIRSEGQRKAVKEGRLKTFKDWTPEQRSKYAALGFKGKTHSAETKAKISENNGSNLSDEIMQSRFNDYIEIEKRRGYIGKLAKKWFCFVGCLHFRFIF